MRQPSVRQQQIGDGQAVGARQRASVLTDFLPPALGATPSDTIMTSRSSPCTAPAVRMKSGSSLEKNLLFGPAEAADSPAPPQETASLGAPSRCDMRSFRGCPWVPDDPLS